jgi:SnoaL-like domain
MSLTDADERGLRSLASRYAFSVDSADGAGFADTFTSEGCIRVFYPGAQRPPRVVAGGAELRTVPQRLDDMYDTTFHFLGQTAYTPDGDGATGRVYCLAHHLTRAETGDVDLVMHIRYEDSYVRDNQAEWKFAVREVHVLWTESRPVNALEGAQR